MFRQNFTLKQILWTKEISRSDIEQYEDNVEIRSDSFEVNQGEKSTKWHIKFFPNGIDENTKGQTTLFLCLDEMNNEFEIKFQLMFIDEDGEQVNSEMSATFDEFIVSPNHGLKTFNFFPQSELWEGPLNFFFDGHLKIFCQIKITFVPDMGEWKEETEEEPKVIEINLKSDIQKMFNEGIFADFKIKTNEGKVFNVHKCFLATRSKVFEKMLSSDMKEVAEGVIEVSDLDYNTMKEVLRFIYCDEVENLDENARKLVYAAEKYELDGLKKICIESIVKKLTTKNVVQALIIADRISGGEKMYEKCLKFIETKYNMVSKTKDWAEMEKDVAMKVQHDLLCLMNTDWNKRIYI